MKKAVIIGVGAEQGLGSQLAKRFASEGLHVFIAGRTLSRVQERASEIDNIHRELTREIEQSEKRLLLEIKAIRNDIGARVGMLEKYRWIILGAAIVIGWIVSGNFEQIVKMMS